MVSWGKFWFVQDVHICFFFKFLYLLYVSQIPEYTTNHFLVQHFYYSVSTDNTHFHGNKNKIHYMFIWRMNKQITCWNCIIHNWSVNYTIQYPFYGIILNNTNNICTCIFSSRQFRLVLTTSWKLVVRHQRKHKSCRIKFVIVQDHQLAVYSRNNTWINYTHFITQRVLCTDTTQICKIWFKFTSAINSTKLLYLKFSKKTHLLQTVTYVVYY